MDKKKKLKLYQIILVAVFTATLVGFGIFSIISKKPTYSERENRTLNQYPKFTLETLLNGTFFSETESAYNDTFPLRDFFVDVKNTIDGLLTIQTDDVIFIPSKDDYGEEELPTDEPTSLPTPTVTPTAMPNKTPLPSETPEGTIVPSETELVPTATPEPTQTPDPTYRPFDGTGYSQFENGKTLSGTIINGKRAMRLFNGSLTSAKAWTDYIKDIKLKYSDKNIVSFVVPSEAAFYANKEYQTENHDEKAWLELVNKNLDGIVTPNLYEALKPHESEYIYFYTDHHWTARGAYYGYQALCKSLGLKAVDIADTKEGYVSGNFYGTHYTTTGSTVLKNNPDRVYYYEMTVGITSAYEIVRGNDLNTKKNISVIDKNTQYTNKYKCFIDGDNSIVYIKTTAGTGRSCVIIKDSYANALVPWLCHNYDSITLVDPRHINTTENNKLYIGQVLEENADADDVIFCCYSLMASNLSDLYYQGLVRFK